MSPAVLHILLALAPGAAHGYAIMQQTGLGPGTLYDNLQKLLTQGLIRETAGDDPRRKNYQLTTVGRRTLSAEIERLEQLFQKAKEHLNA